MNSTKIKKTLIKLLPYIIVGLVCTNLGEAWRLAEGVDMGKKMLSFFSMVGVAFGNPLPSLHPLDLLVGTICGGGLRLAVYLRGKNAKHYRHNEEYGSARWATVYNLKQMSKTLLFLRDHNIGNLEQLQALASEKASKRDELLSSIQASEKRLAEIAALKKHIINYSKTRSTYEAYRKAGYSKKFFEAHREEITLHKAAKQAFDELGVRKIPKVKELSEEYAEILTGKKAAYAEYRKVRDEAQELIIAERNIATLYEVEEKERKDQILQR